jgi:hypothetical protein
MDRTTMVSWWPLRGVIGCALGALPACVSEHTVEDDVKPAPGIVEPDGSSAGTVSSATACERITAARKAAAASLGCDLPQEECPGYLYVAGSVPCDEYTAGSVETCEKRIGAYEHCADFSAKACVVTAVIRSCHKAPAPEAGPKADGASPKKLDGSDGSG